MYLNIFSPQQVKNKQCDRDWDHVFILRPCLNMVANSLYLTIGSVNLQIQHSHPATTGQVGTYMVSTT
jgi:hypothetical protein